MFRIFNKLKLKNPDNQFSGVLIAPKELDWRAEALIIIQEVMGFIGDKAIYRYHLLNNWAYTYWKSRAYLTACIAIAWKKNIYIRGIYKPKEFIETLANGETLLGWDGEGTWELGHKQWYPEDMALHPDKYLKDINPEKDNFGLKSALRLWLDLDQEGYMDARFEIESRIEFENALKEFEK